MALTNGELNFIGQIKNISSVFSCYFWGYRVITKRRLFVFLKIFVPIIPLLRFQ
jgi:hypothetical protein